MIFRVTLLIVCALLAGVISEPRPRPRPVPIYSNQFAVYVPSGLEAADEIAQEHGFDNHGQVSAVCLVLMKGSHGFHLHRREFSVDVSVKRLKLFERTTCSVTRLFVSD
ncbi:hypothetical protein X777_13088 [Ooceraea biroi]|uniref:Peptidase S8 pro-domain domain-containing protein n=1 Tax=Ooceraea biroi TaxID=2015173 RepID=A0A026WYP0_OOCBI|nr:hypothetical protein X777_13088 [Ooceraea biroi]